MTEAERASYFEVALALGRAMHLSGLPTTYAEYRAQRRQQLLEDYYARGPLTDELYARYRQALGPLRFGLLRLVQASVLPGELRDVLQLEPHLLVDQLLRCYRFLPGGGNKLRPLHYVLLPGRFAKQLREMERAPDALWWRRLWSGLGARAGAKAARRSYGNLQLAGRTSYETASSPLPSRLSCKQKGDRRGSNPRPPLEPQSAESCFQALPYVAG
jgi:hypothetical protein